MSSTCSLRTSMLCLRTLPKRDMKYRPQFQFQFQLVYMGPEGSLLVDVQVVTFTELTSFRLLTVCLLLLVPVPEAHQLCNLHSSYQKPKLSPNLISGLATSHQFGGPRTAALVSKIVRRLTRGLPLTQITTLNHRREVITQALKIYSAWYFHNPSSYLVRPSGFCLPILLPFSQSSRSLLSPPLHLQSSTRGNKISIVKISCENSWIAHVFPIRMGTLQLS